jgi:hypothetical protein
MGKMVYVVTLTAPGTSGTGNQAPAPLAEPYESHAAAWFDLFKYMAVHAKPRINRDKAKLWDFFYDLSVLGAAEWGIHRYTIQPVHIDEPPADDEGKNERPEPGGDG